MEFGARLRELRAGSGATLADVAEATGISIAMLSRMENGQRLPSPRFADALARYFGVPVDEFLADVVSDSVRSRYGLEPDEYAASLSAERDWAPAQERMRAIREDLQRKAADLRREPDSEPQAGPPPVRDVPAVRLQSMRPLGSMPDVDRDVPIREDEDGSGPDHDSIEIVHQVGSRAYSMHPVGELFEASSGRSPSDDAALAQRASLRHLRQIVHSGDPEAAADALRAAADLAEDPLALLREAAAHPDLSVRETARSLLDRLKR